MTLDDWFDNLWNDYTAMTPNVSRIKTLLEELGEKVQNDHVAFRTFDLEPINIESLRWVFEAMGYEEFDRYEFTEKKLDAISFVHPDKTRPRVFISELRTGEFSDLLQGVTRELVAQLDPDCGKDPAFFWSGRSWQPVSWQTYQALREESEYGAWVTALGMRPNHFTVSVNALEKFDGIDALLDWVVEQGYDLNESGGRIKGRPDVYLEQGSTMADRIAVDFAGDIRRDIPTCYYEFALRYPTADGSLFDGFVTKSADKIFESTNDR